MSTPAAIPFATRDAFAAALSDFINHELPRLHAKMKSTPGVDRDTPLFTSGIIDSMAILYLISFVEQTTSRSIPPEKVVMKHFRTVSTIAESFWEPGGNA
jgi:acyl carrier protein